MSNWYRLYINSVGGGTECEGPREFNSKEYAMDEARLMAIDDYESFEGYHGIVDCGEIMDNPEDYGIEEGDSDAAWATYEGIKEDSLDYWVEEATGAEDIDEDYQ